MPKNLTITPEYFKKYRLMLGFTSQGATEDFLAAKDIVPKVDFSYLNALNRRLYEIVDRINAVVADKIKITNLAAFKRERIDRAFLTMRKSGILALLNNQGRRTEQVYFNWMRGYVTQHMFLKALALIFQVNVSDIVPIGEDELKTVESFKRAPTADLELPLSGGRKVRIETQSGFLGMNDIKQHKVLEAKRIYREKKLHTVAIHFDFYNGQVAFLNLDELEEDNMNWITRQQMEGQTVFNINQNYFCWRLTDTPPKYQEINFN